MKITYALIGILMAMAVLAIDNGTDNQTVIIGPENNTDNQTIDNGTVDNGTIDNGTNGTIDNGTINNSTIDNGTNQTIDNGTNVTVDNGTIDNGTIDNGTIDPEDNETGGPRFALGFNKLPKMVENGEITDEELAGIINNNKLNPGIINRLIKTGMLGNASIEAILANQEPPKGILGKLFGRIKAFFGKKAVSTQIYETYNYTSETLLMQDDLPKKYANQIKNQLKKQTERKIQKCDDCNVTEPKHQNGTKNQEKHEEKVLNAGKQNGGQGNEPLKGWQKNAEKKEGKGLGKNK